MKTENKIHFYGVVFLLIIFILTIIITIYNRQYDLKIEKEIKKAIIIDDGKFNKKNDGKLVLIRGVLDYSDKFAYDDLFYVTAFTPKFLRYVEMYQWYEYKTTDKNGKTIYKYDKKWSHDLINSDNFKDKTHVNPKNKIAGTLYRYSNIIKVGDYVFSEKQKQSLPCKTRIKLTDVPVYGNYKIYNNYVTNSENPKNPKVGDNRVSYYYNDWEYVSILAKQKNNSFDDYVISNNKKINIIKKNKQSIKKLIKFIMKKI